MSYIAPNGVIKLLKGVELDSSYNHTVRFNSAAAQFQALTAYTLFTFNNQMYTRVNKGVLRISRVADDLIGVNYMIFTNTRNNVSKHYYAFVDSIDYINEGVSEIHYTIDVMQTWMFDYEIGQCFIEREHSATDAIAENRVPENLETGQLVSLGETHENYNLMLAGLVTNKRLPLTFATRDGTANTSISWQTSSVTAPCGVSNSLYYYTGILVDTDDGVALYPSSATTRYRMQDAFVHYNPETYDTYWCLGDIIDWIVNDVGGSGWSEDNIVYAYQYPAKFNLITALTDADTLNYRAGTAVRTLSLTRPTAFGSYTPKNNKVFTYPYMQVLASNNAGQTSELKWEDILYNNAYDLKIISAYNTGCTALLYPSRYLNKNKGWDNGLALTNFPVPAYKGSAYTQWIQQNRSTVATSLISTVVSGAGKVALGAVAQNYLGMGIAAATTIANVAGTLGKVEDVKNTPPEAHGQVVCDTLNTAANRTGFSVYYLGLTEEYARIIDNYFTEFGYACHKVKTPNVFSNTRRPHWNYVKTQGCIIHAKKETEEEQTIYYGVPADDEKKISQIFDNGITFWENLSEVGDYTLNNSPA